MPQVKKAVHWTQVLFELREVEDHHMLERELAAKYGIPPDHPDMLNAVGICLRQRKITRVTGLTTDKQLGIMLLLNKEDDDE